jgi:hypothetical protein
MFRDVFSAYKSTGALQTSMRILLNWDLDGKLASLLKVGNAPEIGEETSTYFAPDQRTETKVR